MTDIVKPRRRDVRLGDTVRLIPGSDHHKKLMTMLDRDENLSPKMLKVWYKILENWCRPRGTRILSDERLASIINKPENFDSWELLSN